MVKVVPQFQFQTTSTLGSGVTEHHGTSKKVLEAIVPDLYVISVKCEIPQLAYFNPN